MLDPILRPAKDRLLSPVAAGIAAWAHPHAITAVGFAIGCGCAAVCATGRPELRGPALLLWGLSRVVDGLDGAVARRRGEASDLGGYLDIMVDFVVYALVPLGLAFGVRAYTGAEGSESAVWVWLAALLASFYVNAASWMYLAAILEKRGHALTAGGGPATSIVMPTGIIEGTETIVLYALYIAVPAALVPLFALTTVLVLATTLQRVVWAVRKL
jgi:phosphatidylglycerophosphate synthase